MWAAFPYFHKISLVNATGLEMRCCWVGIDHTLKFGCSHIPVYMCRQRPSILLCCRLSSMMASLLSMHGSCSGLPAAAVSQRCLACGLVCADLLETDSLAC